MGKDRAGIEILANPRKDLKDDDIMTEKNVETFIENAIQAYFDKHRLVDAMFWREAIRMYRNKLLGKRG